ncbi:hypothetical protein ASE00_02115 [Sphingomonas sp. Root710]|uniref:DUF2059 domain-containing protein n=1 Tax=Sphingomonas sp. Root710 TaxID=1736594 RepID=UPI0007015323|nr:DUF2059 domain-containing protein [Sphingomonas sp. Root710]KRB85607.1 hypothetical protein ASE00_02115 [Sphingomonas sp. Root710]
MMRVAVFAAAIAFASPVLAQATPDAARLAAARDFIQVSDIRAQMKATGPRLAEAMGRQMRQMFQDNAVPEGLNTELTAAMQAYVASMDSVFTPAVIDKFALIYAQHFTTEELRRVIALMNDPVMVRMRAETPAIATEMMPIMFEVMQPRQQQFQQKVMQIVTDWIKNHPADKAKLRSPTAS